MSGVRRVWVTRAQPGADRTAARLAALGFEPVVAPLLDVRPLPVDPPDLTGVAALAFTSANGVAAFAALLPDRRLPVFAVGDATAAAARGAGFSQVASAGGDLIALAALLDAHAPRDGLVLAPGPRQPSGDLAAAVRVARVQAVALYETVPVPARPQRFDAVLIHSGRAAQALAEQFDIDLTQALVVAISPAVAAPLGGRPVTNLRPAERPDEAAMIAALGKPGAPV